MRWLAALAVLLVAGPVWAVPRNYYVEAGVPGAVDTCDGTNGDEGDPFATPYGCVLCMNAGDTCLIKNGTYVRNGPDYYIPGFNFCQRDISGSPGAYTTIKNYPGHSPLLCSSPVCTNNTYPTIGVYRVTGCSYIRLEGLRVDGSLEVRGEVAANVHHITVTGSEFWGGSHCEGNYAPVRVENANNLQFDHNLVHRLQRDSCTMYEASIVKSYNVSDSIYEYNTYLDDGDPANIGFHEKTNGRRNTHRYNWFGPGFYTWGGLHISDADGDAVTPGGFAIYGNVFYSRLHIRENQTPLPTYGANIYSNTFLDQPTLGYVSQFPSRNFRFVDNLVTDLVTPAPDPTINIIIREGAWTQLATHSIDYNWYDPGGTYEKNYQQSGSASYGNLVVPPSPSWQTAIQAGGCSGCEAHSHEADVTFSDSLYNLTCGGSPNPCAVTLSSGSPGEVGAYGVTDCVGYTCGAAPSVVVCNDGIDNDGDGACDHADADSRDSGHEDYNAACAALDPDDGCLSAAGTAETKCGDGFPDLGEQCDCGAEHTCTAQELRNETCESRGYDYSTSTGLSCGEPGTCTYVVTNCHYECEPVTGVTLTASADSASACFPVANAVDTDGDGGDSIWHTEYNGGACGAVDTNQPHQADIDMGSNKTLCGFTYRQRHDGGANGNIYKWELYTCANGGDCGPSGAGWGAPKAQGEWTYVNGDRPSTETLNAPISNVRYVRLLSRDAYLNGGLSGGLWTNAADIVPRTINVTNPPPCRILSISSAMTDGASAVFQLSPQCGTVGTLEFGDNLVYASGTKVAQTITEKVSGRWTGEIALTVGDDCSEPRWAFLTPDGGSPSDPFAVVLCTARGQLGTRRVIGG